MKNKSIVPKPYSPELSQELNSSSWVVIDASTQHGVSVVFFNNDEAQDSHKFDSFNEFAQAYFDDEFMNFDDKTIKINDSKAIATGSKSYTEEDFDENSPRGKTYTVYVGEAQVIDIYKSIELNKIDDLVIQIKKDLSNSEAEAVDAQKDSNSYNKDHYAYYGLSKRDFI